MAMQAASLEVLEQANVPAPQARAIVRAIEIELAGAQDALATKHDVLLLRTELHQDVAGLRQEIAGVRLELGQEIAGLRQELLKETTAVRRELSEWGRSLELRYESLRADVRGTEGRLARQMYTALLGQMAVLLGILYFFTTHVMK